MKKPGIKSVEETSVAKAQRDQTYKDMLEQLREYTMFQNSANTVLCIPNREWDALLSQLEEL